MTRREVLRYSAMMVGGSLATPVVTSLLSGCQSAPKQIPFTPKYFNAQQFEFIKAVVTTILPNGEVPGALEVGVHQVIDHMVGVVYSQADRNSYSRGLELLMNMLNAKGAPNHFAKLTAEEKNKWLTQYESDLQFLNTDDNPVIDVKSIQLFNEAGQVLPLTVPQEKALRKAIYGELKQQTIAYFLSSEEIGTKHLNYLPVPGKYEACISLESVGGKSWAI